MLTESMEDYLEAIYRLTVEKGYVRAVDISERLDIQASSITRMIKKLHDIGFLSYEKYRNIALTTQGTAYGRFLVWRDQTLEEFLHLLTSEAGIQDQVEGIEHYITPTTMGLIRNLIAYFNTHPHAIQEIHRLNQNKAYPDGEELGALRAWSFRHAMEE